MDKILILNRIREHYGLTKDADFARFLGINSQNIRNWYARNNYNANLLIEKCEDIRPEFIITGKGEMLKSQDNFPVNQSTLDDRTIVPLLPISAQGGSFNDFVAAIKENDCEKVVSPIKAADFAITVSGDSMAPEYPSGCHILIKKINEKAFIEWGKVYVLDTCNGTVIKEIHKGNTDDEIECYSINPDPKFHPFPVKLSDIYGMYRVLMCMSLK